MCSPSRPRVVAVHSKASHAFSKDRAAATDLVEGLGVAGDAHAGATVKPRSRVAKDPTQPNLRQVRLLHHQLLLELASGGFAVAPGQLGENITTTGLDLRGLPEGTVLGIGATATVRITGLRNPCAQIEAFRPGLLAAVLGRAPDGSPIRKSGVMAVVLQSGPVVAGDAIRAVHVPERHRALQPVRAAAVRTSEPHPYRTPAFHDRRPT